MTMIRLSSTNHWSKENIRRVPILTSSSSSTIKSNIKECWNPDERTNATFHSPHLRFNIGCHFSEVNKKKSPEDFNEKYDIVGFSPDSLSNKIFQDHAEDDIRTSPNPIKKECEEEEPKYLFDDKPRNSSAMRHMDGLIFGSDHDDQMLFPWKELEKDMKILANRKPNSIDGDFSEDFDHLGTAPISLTPISSGLSDKYVRSNHSSSVDSALPSFSWSETKTLANPNGKKFPIEGSPTLKDSCKTTREMDARCHRNNHLINNGGVLVPASSRSVAAPSKYPKANSITRHKHWTEEEDEILRSAMADDVDYISNWSKISRKYFHSARSATQCKNRWRHHLQPGLVRGRWSVAEDQLILKLVSQGNTWKAIASKLPGRIGESIRGRYVNHLDPTLNKSPWTAEEDDILFENQRKLGNKWSEIRKLLNGRSDNSIKNRYNNKKSAYFRKIRNHRTENPKNKPMRASPKAMFVDVENSKSCPAPPSSEDLTDVVVAI